MEITKRTWLFRAVAGGLIGMAALFLVGGACHGLVNGSLLGGPVFFPISPDLIQHTGSTTAAALIQFGLYFLLGAEAGVATLPFAEESGLLLLRSLLHFVCVTGTFSVLAWLCGWTDGRWSLWLTEIGLLALFYVLVWLGRWVSWCTELDAIRVRLGLDPIPSPLKWRESLPHVGFAALLCLGVPILSRLLLAAMGWDAPAIVPILFLTPLAVVAGTTAGISLGKRQGFCPLYPAACGVFYLLALSTLYTAPTYVDLLQAVLVLAGALAGNLFGARRKRRVPS